jgi:predicted membrane protein
MLPLLKPRLPAKIFSSEEIKIDTKVFAQAIFISSTFSNIFQGLGFFLPFIYIPCKTLSPPDSPHADIT